MCKPMNCALPARMVLIADNCERNRRYYKTCLSRLGYSCKTAKDGREAVETFQAQPERFALILMEVRIPHLDGPHACRRIRESCEAGRRVAVVVMTADASEDTRLKCMKSGVDDFHLLPCPPNKIEAIIEKWVEPDS